MPPSQWDEEDEGGSPPPVVLPRRNKFDDEEEGEVLDSWDADDSEEEREKAKAAEAEAEAKTKAAAATAKAKAADSSASKLSRTQRIEALKEARRREAEAAEWDEDEDEDEAAKRARLRATEKESDLAHAATLFGEEAIGGVEESAAAPAKKPAVLDIGDVDMQKMKNRSVVPKSVVVNDPSNPTNAVDLSKMTLFKPTTKDQYTQLTNTLVPLLTTQTRKPQYSLWAQDFVKQLVKDLPSGDIRKIASVLTTASNEKMREEKAAEKGKKSKAAKTKVSLAGNTRAVDTTNYEEDGLDDGDFM